MRNKRPIVLLDCDGVLSDFIGGVLEIVKNVTGLIFSREDVGQFDFCAALGIRGMDASLIRGAIGERGFCESLKPYEGAQAGVRSLQEIAEVYVVTSPWNSSPTWTHERESWLWRHFKIPHSRVLHTSAKHLVAGDLFVDDKTSTVVAWRDAWPGRHAVRWNTPHNASEAWEGAEYADWSLLCLMVSTIADTRLEFDLTDVDAESPDRFDLGGEA